MTFKNSLIIHKEKNKRKKCLMSVYLTKVRQNFTSNFLDLKKTDLNISTRSISEILTLFKKFAVICNQNLEIHSGWSFKQYLIIEWGTYIIILKVKSCLSLLKFLRYSQSTGHIPQVISTCHCSIDELPNHTDSPLSNRAFC